MNKEKKFLFWWCITWLTWCAIWACYNFIYEQWPYGVLQIVCASIFIKIAYKNANY